LAPAIALWFGARHHFVVWRAPSLCGLARAIALWFGARHRSVVWRAPSLCGLARDIAVRTSLSSFHPAQHNSNCNRNNLPDPISISMSQTGLQLSHH
jgi:hypothetical protein